MKKNIKILLIVISCAVFLAFAVLVAKAIYDKQMIEEQVETVVQATPAPTATPVPKEPILIIDASNMYASEVIDAIAEDINAQQLAEVSIVKCDYKDIEGINAAMADSGNVLIIAPEDVLIRLDTTYNSIDLSKYSYTSMAQNNPETQFIPYGYSVYSYVVRYDLAQHFELPIPNDYGEIMEFARSMTEISGLYGFAVSSMDTSSAMMANQITSKYNDDNVYLATILDFLWQNKCIPPDSGMMDDTGCAVAYAKEAVTCAYTDGYGLNYIYRNNDYIYNVSQIYSYFGQEASFAVRPVSIGAVGDCDMETVYAFVDRLYYRSAEIFNENPGFVPVEANTAIDTPYAQLMNQTHNFLYYDDDLHDDFLESIVYYSLPVEEVAQRK